MDNYCIFFLFFHAVKYNYSITIAKPSFLTVCRQRALIIKDKPSRLYSLYLLCEILRHNPAFLLFFFMFSWLGKNKDQQA